jgi:hypothetical protein
MKIMPGTVEALIYLKAKYNEDMQKPDVSDVEILTNRFQKQFCCVFINLDAQVQNELVALFWLGDSLEEDYKPENFPELVEQAKSTADEGTAAYLLGKRKLVESWTRGMHMLGLI